MSCILFIGILIIISSASIKGDEVAAEEVASDDGIPKEFATGKKIDVTQHKNIQLLPTECGFIDKEDPAAKSALKLFIPKLTQKNPWIVRIVVEDQKGVRSPACAGTLISQRYILTSATCASAHNTGNKISSVILGGSTACENVKCVPVSKVWDVSETVIHPDYVFPTRQNDIAIVKLAKDITPETYMKPVCLPLTETLFANFKNNKSTAVGWTRVEEGSLTSFMLYPRQLRTSEMKFESRDYCDRFYKRSHAKFEHGRLCASSDPNKASCADDDGGPLLKTVTLPDAEHPRTYQIGLVSFHHKLCGQPGIPMGFTNIIAYMPWILDNMSLE